MATTSVHSIYSTQAEALEYIVNPQKTESGLFVTSYGCSDDPKEAAEFFESTRNSIGTGRTSVLARHIHQNFAPGEITPEEAFRVGQKLCEKLFNYEYQYVLTTHTDKEHIHNHIIVNNVNLFNGLSLNYLADKGKDNQLFQKIRNMSDELCREHSLSVIEDPELGKGQKWYEWSQDKQGLSWKSKLKYELDCLIMRSENFDDFLKKCKENNIEAVYNPEHKIDLKFRMEGQEKFSRAKTLGWYYETPQIKKRIENFKRYKNFSLDSKPKTKIIDTAADKFQQAKGLERWANIQNMKEASRMIDMLTKYGISGVDEVAPAAISTSMHRAKLVEELNGLQREITEVSETLEALRVFQKHKPFMLKLKELPDRKKKNFAEKYSREIEKYKSAGAKLKEKYPDGKVPSEEVLTEKRNALIEQRNKSNAEYKEVKSKLKDVDYARQAIDDYFKNQRDVQQKKRKKDDLE